jgi:cation diffusion facilitator CzcD-associated flavoprotein CzcO
MRPAIRDREFSVTLLKIMARGGTPMATASRRIAIIGSGFAGLCLGIQLKKRGNHSFTIFEKSDRVGGTWRDNTYPGACCDVPAFAYCFSFEPKTDWSRKWAPQSEILQYMEHCARKYDLMPHIRFNTEIAEARWVDEESAWRIRTTAGQEIVADVLVSGVGQLNRPFTPKFAGAENFRGVAFHSAQWRHDVDLTGLNVAVVGNAASAIQFIPQIAPRVTRLHIFQRSANWMIPRGDRPYSEAEKRRFAKYPTLAKAYRWWIWLRHEMNWPMFRGSGFVSKRTARLAERHMRSIVKDPKLQEVLVPDYPIGGKRILISDDYYPALNRKNVEVITDPIDHIAEHSIVTRGGREVAADVIIYATGFESTAFLAPIRIEGRNHRALHDEWKGGARAYLGITVPGFPNLFLMYGPNTNLGHNSIIFMIECQTNYILDCLAQMDARGITAIDLRREVLDAFDARLQSELERTVWAVTAKSWYKTEEGRITNNWCGTTTRYWWKTRHADLSLYHQTAAARAEVISTRTARQVVGIRAGASALKAETPLDY